MVFFPLLVIDFRVLFVCFFSDNFEDSFEPVGFRVLLFVEEESVILKLLGKDDGCFGVKINWIQCDADWIIDWENVVLMVFAPVLYPGDVRWGLETGT